MSLAAVVIAALVPLGASPAHAVEAPTQPLLMAFHACSAGGPACYDPRNHVVWLAQGSDGTNWTVLPGWVPYSGSVPDVFRRGNTAYIYSSPGSVARLNLTTGVLTPNTPVTLTDGSGFVDPSMAQLPDGRLVLFYLPGQIGSEPAGCGGTPSCVREIRSAIEVAGSDGTSFTPNGTPHISVTLTVGTFSDPDVFFNGSTWVLYVSRGRSTEAYASSDLLGSYTKVADITNNQGGVPAGIRMDNGSVLTLVSSDPNILSGTSPNGTISLNGALSTSASPSLVPGSTLVGSPGLGVNTAGIPLPESVATTSKIRCKKGKLTKRFTGKCPAGWKPVSG